MCGLNDFLFVVGYDYNVCLAWFEERNIEFDLHHLMANYFQSLKAEGVYGHIWFFSPILILRHQRSVTTFSHQTKQMYWNSVDTILLVQLWRIIKLVTYTVAAWKKFMYSCLAHKTFLYILGQIFPLLHNGLRLLFNSCVILIQCWVFNFIFHIFDYANSWLSGLFGPVHTSGNNQGAMVLCNSGTSDYAALVILCRTLQHTLELVLCRGNKQWRSSLRISTLLLR